MAAPTHTSRINPSVGEGADIPLQDGHATLVTLGANADIAIWEKTVTPPGYDGGDPIDLTTMHNIVYRTSGPRALVTMTDITMTGLYDPIMYTEILARVNQEDTITVTFADGTQVSFFGFVQSFTPQDHAEGTPPEAQILIHPTNWDYENDVEAGPLVTEVAGS